MGFQLKTGLKKQLFDISTLVATSHKTFKLLMWNDLN